MIATKNYVYYKLQNLRTWLFSFKFSPLGHGKNLLTALLHHAFPSRHQLLFAYDYKLVSYLEAIGKIVLKLQCRERTEEEERMKQVYQVTRTNYLLQTTWSSR